MSDISIIITFNPQTGATNIQGPLEQQVLMLGLLEQAKLLTHEHGKKLAERLVQPATAIPQIKL